MSKFLTWSLIIASLLYITQTYGQQVDSLKNRIDTELWTDYNFQASFNTKLSFVGDAGLRGFISNVDFNQVYIRPGVRWQFHRIINLTGSLALFNTFNSYDYNLTEFRVTADLNVKWPDLGFMNITYRARLENRSFFFRNGDKENNYRGRFLISINSKKIKVFSEKRSIVFQAQFEPFYTFGIESMNEFFINQARLYAIFGHRISPAFGYDLQYLWQLSRISAENELQTTQNIFRIRFYHRIGKN